MIRVLRLAGGSNLVSADVFERQFLRSLSTQMDVVRADIAPWFDRVLGGNGRPISMTKAAADFGSITAPFDFVCPDYRGNLFAPLLLALRNHASSRERLLFIAHAPGAYLLEWVLMAPLMRPGDIIIAPSRSAASVISLLCPELDRYVTVIPHPIQPLTRSAAAVPEYIASLGRIVPEKLIHRQIEAMAILRDRGVSMKLMIAGPLNAPGVGFPREYARSLDAKIRRLGLSDTVKLVGEIHGDEAKADFLSRARLLLNLSITVEESFGKSIVEALGIGVPVIATQWNGFADLIGEAGGLIPITDHGTNLDVSADQVADAIEEVLAADIQPSDCIKRIGRCSPARVATRYRKCLEQALATAAAQSDLPCSAGRDSGAASPGDGLLASTAPLGSFSWEELFDLHLQDVRTLRRRLAGEDFQDISDAGRLRSILMTGTQAVVGRFLAGLDFADYSIPAESPSPAARRSGSFEDRLAEAACSRSIPRSILTCLLSLSDALCADWIVELMARIDVDSLKSPALCAYLRADISRQQGDYFTAWNYAVGAGSNDLKSESAGYRLGQIARISREWERPALALPWLGEWLATFPDSPGSIAVWRDYCLNACLAGTDYTVAAQDALDHVLALSGDQPMLDPVE